MKERLLKRVPFAARVAVCLLLIGLLLPAALCVSAQQDPREAAIVADLAGGTDIAVILRNATAAGLSVDRAVEVLVAGGADTGRVVYAAIIAGFTASDVVKGATNAIEGMGLTDAARLTQLAMIVSAAQQAGATVEQVNIWLSNAGVPPAVIASANTLAATTPAPVYGYTAPAGSTPPPTAGIGGAFGSATAGGGLIGGSGIGQPPTGTASRTQP